MKAFLAALLAAGLIAWGAHWVLTSRIDWSSAARFAADETVRLDPAPGTRPGP